MIISINLNLHILKVLYVGPETFHSSFDDD